MDKRKLIVCAAMCAVVLGGCQSLQPAYQCARIPPLPAELGITREPNLTERLLMLLSPSWPRETPPSDNPAP